MQWNLTWINKSSTQKKTQQTLKLKATGDQGASLPTSIGVEENRWDWQVWAEERHKDEHNLNAEEIQGSQSWRYDHRPQAEHLNSFGDETADWASIPEEIQDNQNMPFSAREQSEELILECE